MALIEGYIGKWNEYPEDEVKIRVARPSLLSPSKELLDRYKKDNLSWDEYRQQFILQVTGDSQAVEQLHKIQEQSQKENIRLICYEKNPEHCHRSILLELINLMERE
jgi:uncharacterized protein YeaO (DUF488 family)